MICGTEIYGHVAICANVSSMLGLQGFTACVPHDDTTCEIFWRVLKSWRVASLSKPHTGTTNGLRYSTQFSVPIVIIIIKQENNEWRIVKD